MHHSYQIFVRDTFRQQWTRRVQFSVRYIGCYRIKIHHLGENNVNTLRKKRPLTKKAFKKRSRQQLNTASNATDFMHMVDFTGLNQVCHQVASSLLASSH